jgi:CheY-like chemotaxis protein
MPAELLPSVFDLFRQSERSLDRHKGGLGIGLSIVKSLVELHGGRIRARSDGRGKGSEFEVELTRIAKIRSSGLANDQEFWARDGKNLKVVIVDDNKDAATTISLYLTEKYGCAVSEFTDSAIALEKISEAVPDVCILDIGMPGMDGFTLARRLKSYQALNQSLFIALSGYGSPQDKQKAFAAGFDQHFTKPVDIDELASFIIDAVEKRRQALQAG